MATRTTNAELAETIAGQQKTITQALSRISTLTDEVASLRNEVRRFKQDVAKDVTYLTERVG
jgi:ABC-type transporter Mla subunit MlaD